MADNGKRVLTTNTGEHYTVSYAPVKPLSERIFSALANTGYAVMIGVIVALLVDRILNVRNRRRRGVIVE